MLGRIPHQIDTASRCKPRMEKQSLEESLDQHASQESDGSTNREAAGGRVEQTLKKGFSMATPNIVQGQDKLEDNSKLNQSMVSDKNRYSKYLDEKQHIRA